MNRFLIFSIIFCYCSYGQISSSQIYQHGDGNATIQNSDGSSSQVYDWGNGDKTIQNSDGSSSQIYQYGNGDATIQHSDGGSLQVYDLGNGNNTIQNNQSLNSSNSLKPGEFYKISSQVNNSNQNSTDTDVHGISDEAYDAIGDAAGKLAAILLIRKVEKKYKKFSKEYLKKPSIESAFEIEKYGRRAIYLTKNTAKMINSASKNQNYESNFSGSTSINDKWSPVTEEHKMVVEKFGSYRKYKKSLK